MSKAACKAWPAIHSSMMSGQTAYYAASYENDAQDVLAGRVGRQAAASQWGRPARFNIREYVGPRLMPHDIQAISRDENRCHFNVERGRGFSSFHGFFPMHVDWPMEKEEYDRRLNQMPWPAPTEATRCLKQGGLTWQRTTAETEVYREK